MDEQILARYNSPEGLADYSKKFERHWTERVNNWNEQRLLRELLSAVPRDPGQGVALDLPCGYGRLYPIVRERAKRVQHRLRVPAFLELQPLPLHGFPVQQVVDIDGQWHSRTRLAAKERREHKKERL